METYRDFEGETFELFLGPCHSATVSGNEAIDAIMDAGNDDATACRALRHAMSRKEGVWVRFEFNGECGDHISFVPSEED